MESYIVILFAALLSATPPILIKMYVDDGEKNMIYLFFCLMISVLILMVYINLIKKYNTTVMYSLIKISSIIIVAIISWLLYKQNLSKKTVAGIFFGLIALYLIGSRE